MNTIYNTHGTAFKIKDECILLNNVLFPKSIDSEAAYNPHNVRAWAIGDELGISCMIWASNEQEAFDEACDAGLIDQMLATEQDHDNEELASLGNASELFDLTYAWINEIKWDASRDVQLIVRIIRAVENQQNTLDN